MNHAAIILEVLGHGEERAVSAEYLAKIAGLDDRTLRFAVAALRVLKWPVLSSVKGYYLPAEDKGQAQRECSRFVHMMRHRGVSSLRAARAIEKYSRTLTPQITLDQIDDFNMEDEEIPGNVSAVKMRRIGG